MVANNERFEFQTQHLIDIINKTEAYVVGLQLPEGLKRKSIDIASKLEQSTCVEVIVSANPCYGACDIDTDILDDVDILFHFGHSELDDCKYNEKIYYIKAASEINISEIVKQAMENIKAYRVGVLTTVQHVHKLEEVRKIIESCSRECIIQKGDTRIAYPGQVLGCNFSSAEIDECDEYLYIGSGEFHPVGVAVATGKPVMVADPFMDKTYYVDPSRILRQRSAVIAKSLDSSTFGILVSSKIGQYRMELAKYLKNLAKKHGKKAYILTMDRVTSDQLLQFKVDAFVNTACPRIAIDDVGHFPSPMLTPQEFEIVLGERKWEKLVFDEIRGVQ
ncbi:diphthamide biosynthesis protein [Methanohalobium evestigatum Z-7303]|uniref:2-(3-amino-3-carboxypropyl)histidine synthase n=1 Tax=Methanohalobium evestigatum (strain ATCC BAA-1072 / DSM 3721 / NBRC 107634 / OCM 161 / Z-7303) TaxID=644295 RepID=D7E9E6_METEZ|nr:diphthamide biosynthesis enzyme Dph2 [Methanohalobium evestigatum]ADI74218.1 diphthamide biosynthesis protein [Methanohalobium evestigatum Z-7303]